MNKKSNVKPTTKPAPVVKPVKPPVVSPPAPPAPVWQRFDLPANCDRFVTNQAINHSGATIEAFFGNVSVAWEMYGQGNVNIVPPVGNWQEQTSIDGGKTYRNTAMKFNQLQAGANNTTSVNVTLDGGVGPAKLMRYLLNQESL